jgi:tRNA threonylcarbamoyladenosine biosynthesis protein TsaB
MVVIGVDTSGDRVGVGLLEGDEPAAELVVPAEKRSLPKILPTIDRVLLAASRSIGDVALFSVVLGPGSWTGLRLGVTTVKTLAYALQTPVTGIDTLTALAYGVSHTDRPVVAIVPSRPGMVFLARYRCTDEHPTCIDGPQIVASDALGAHIPDDAVIVGDPPLTTAKGRNVVVPPALRTPRPFTVAYAGLHRFENEGALDVGSLSPLYLQEPQLTTPAPIAR